MKPVFYMFLLPALLSLTSLAQETRKQYNDAQNMPVVVQEEARFPAGMGALLKYFRDSLHYSQEAIDNRVNGQVMVSFDVMPDSSLSEIVVIDGVGFGVDEEVVRLFRQLKYAPSVQNGVIIKMNLMVTIPVRARPKISD
ncbi:MAG TPA: TonB family protein [Bacteroidales bacterium]|nr:TonB family protein [Bacteroidales bacterium]HSA44430.1 TonB family protein [Bacteroidales bacterium]